MNTVVAIAAVILLIGITHLISRPLIKVINQRILKSTAKFGQITLGEDTYLVKGLSPQQRTYFDLLSHIVTVQNSRNQFVGMGVFVAPQIIVTTVDIIRSIEVGVQGEVTVRRVITGVSYLATCLVLSEDNLAILRTIDMTPKEVTGIPLAENIGKENNSLRILTVSSNNPKGTWLTASNKGRSQTPIGDLAISIKDEPWPDRGISGAPIVDTSTNQVIGMLSGMYQSTTSKYPDTIAISSEILSENLKEYL